MKAFLRFLILLLASLLILNAALVAAGRAQFPAQPGPRFNAQIDMTHRDGIAAAQPQIVLLGDSMVEENVDAEALSRALGRGVYPVSYPGASSALWYLSVKNNIAASEPPPQALVILFRDSVLTTPAYRVGGKFDAAIDTLAGADEAILLQLAYLNNMNPLERLARGALPLYAVRIRLRDTLENPVRFLLPRALLGCGKRCVDNAQLAVFNFRTIALPAANDPVAQEESILYTARSLDFAAQVKDSFLPEIIRLCRARGIQLIFVRGKTISFINLPKPRGLDGYILALQDYLTKNGASFADLEADARLEVADYIDRFHVQPEARDAYTQMLAEALIPLLP